MTGTTRRTVRPLRVLLVDDGAADGGFARDVLTRAAAPNAVTPVASVAEAAPRLAKDGGASGADLVVLHAAPAAVREALASLKSLPALQHVPVVVVADDAASAADLLSFYRLHASCCVRAPSDREALAALLEATARYWLGGQVILPGGRPAGPPA